MTAAQFRFPIKGSRKDDHRPRRPTIGSFIALGYSNFPMS